MRSDEYKVGLANYKHIYRLVEVERAAAAMFPDDCLPGKERIATVPVEQLEVACTERRLWTAVTSQRLPVGFAIAAPQSQSVFLQEVSVHPEHQNRGLGRLLIRQVIAWAQQNRFGYVRLTTFEHVPWNAPFYSRLGFRILAESDLDDELIKHLQAERQR